MANNVFGGRPNAVVAKTDISFASAGITALNTLIIYLVDNPLKSYVPGRAINGITGFEANKGYYMVPLTDMDLEDVVVPPIEGGGGGGGFDTDAQAFIDATGITNSTQQTAINTLVLALKAASIWVKFKAIYPFVGGTATTHKYNLRDPRDLDAAFRLSFTGGVIHNSRGIFGGTGKTIDTHFVPSVELTADSVHASYYSDDDAGLTDYMVYVADSGKELAIAYSGGTLYGRISNATTGAVVVNPFTDSDGLTVVTRTDSATLKLFTDAVQQGSTQTGAGGPLPSLAVQLLPYDTIARPISFASLGEGFSDSEVAALTTAVNAFQTSLARA